MKKNELSLYLIKLIAFVTLVLMISSSVRHALLQTGALDLALFDQWIYLLSRDVPPISSFFNFHVLGDHAAFILYPISLLYRISPDIHWMLIIQALSLAMGVLPLYALGIQSGLSKLDCKTLSLCYVLYPAIFNVNFYADFRPESIAVPSMLWAVWAGIEKKTMQLVLSIFLVLVCKDILSLSIIALGIWFWIAKHRRVYAFACIALGSIWCGFTIGFLVPLLRNGEPGGIGFYNSLGGSLSKVAFNVLTNPALLVSRALAFDSLFYYLLLVAPVILCLHWRRIGILIPALPMLFLNILSDYQPQRDLIHHYSLPIFPFVILWFMTSLGTYRKQGQRHWLNLKLLVSWSIIAFLALGKYDYFFTRYLSHLSNISSAYQAISLVQPNDSVLATSYFCPHLSHRLIIRELSDSYTLDQVKQYDSVLFDIGNPPQNESPSSLIALKEQLKNISELKVIYDHDDIVLLSKHFK